MKITPVILAVTLCAGCGVYRHQRPVVLSVAVQDGQTNLVIALEKTSVKLFLQRMSATKIRTAVKDGDYARDVTVGGLGSQGDAEMVQALGAAVQSGAESGVISGLIRAKEIPGGLPPGEP